VFRSTSARLLGLLAVSAALLSGPTAAQAQNPRLEPTYGSVSLRVGFTPDPYTVTVTSGGPIQTNRGGVRSWVASAPDFRLHYTAGSLPLTFRVESPGDTTLLIVTPDGDWYANDDDDGSLNPRLTFRNPQSGRYDVWVGSFSENGSARATLRITEIR
jgi:hypothetical protein